MLQIEKNVTTLQRKFQFAEIVSFEKEIEYRSIYERQ